MTTTRILMDQMDQLPAVAADEAFGGTWPFETPQTF